MVTFNEDVSYNTKTLQQKLRSDSDGVYDPEKHIAVTKIFPTIQGEAPFAGHPAIFLRLAGCNRGSKIDKGCYFCDTFFSVNKDTQLYTVEALAVELERVSQGMAEPLLVITGGEPMLQAAALMHLLPLIAGSGYYHMIQFETNGDLFTTNSVHELIDLTDEINEAEAEEREEDPEDYDFINFVISPKRTIKEPNSGAFTHLDEHSNVYVRLVISGDPESIYYTIPQFLLDSWPRNAFWLSPLTEYKKKPDDNEIVNPLEDIDLELTRRNIERAMKLANMYGLRLSLQAHSYIGIP